MTKACKRKADNELDSLTDEELVAEAKKTIKDFKRLFCF